MKYQCSKCFNIYTCEFIKEQNDFYLCSHCGHRSTLISDGNPFIAGRLIGGDFRIESRIGEGSSGVVFLATQISLDRQVALKIFFDLYDDIKDRHIQEGRIISKLNHPNIVSVYGAGTDKQICYIATEFIKGSSLKSVINEQGALPVDEALHYIQQTAEGLYAAWNEFRILHCDVKSQNILITQNGIPKITDFRCATASESEEFSELDLLGNQEHISPEITRGEQPSSASDIYSLGVTLYYLLTSIFPFSEETTVNLSREFIKPDDHLMNNLEDIEIPEAVKYLLLKMLAANGGDRIRDMRELINAIVLIRKSIAPDPKNVPTSNTTSFNKLDYSLQREAIRKYDTTDSLETVMTSPKNRLSLELKNSRRTAKQKYFVKGT